MMVRKGTQALSICGNLSFSPIKTWQNKGFAIKENANGPF